MAWNEPGNQNDKDPWSGKRGGGNQGPPDLDEIIQKLQQRLSGIFGGKRGSSSGSGATISGGFLVLILLVLVGAWAVSGVYQIDQKERGVVLRLGKFLETVQPGLHWNPPLVDEVTKVNVTTVQEHATRGRMLTEDENIVEVQLKVQYVISDPKAYVLNVRDPEQSLAEATESVLRHVVGSTAMDQVITEGREVLGSDIRVRLQDYIERYQTGLLISQVNVEDSDPPREVQAAFDDVIKAREDEVRVKNEAEAYANGIVPVARGYAQRLLEEANGYKEQVIARASGEADRFSKLLEEYEKAPEVTRERLYIDAMESVLSNSSKIMVDVEGGNNMMYLPLDKILQDNSTGSTGRLQSRDLDQVTNQVLDRIRQLQSDSSTAREGR